jgi:hypothetical protein
MSCIKKYFTNFANVGLQTNIVKMNGNPDDGFIVDFPKPFLINGFGEMLPAPSTSPLYPESRFNYRAIADQNTYKELPLTLFIAFMYANRTITNPLTDAVAYEELPYAKFAEYFDQHLNDALFPINYNPFAWPQNHIANVWGEMFTTPPPQGINLAMLELQQFLFQNSDKRLWGAPGRYYLNSPAVLGNQVFTPITEYEVYFTNGNEASNFGPIPPIMPIKLSTGMPSFIWIDYLNTPGIIRWGSNVVPYAGSGPASPDFDALPFQINGAIELWIKDVLTAETGDVPAFIPPAAPSTGYGVSTEGTTDYVTFACTDDYTFGTLALANGEQKRLHIAFEGPPQAPFWDLLVDYFNNVADPRLILSELKSIE